MSDDRSAYLWHLSNARWEAAMEAIEEDDAVHPKTIKGVHEKFLANRGHKVRRNATRKNLAKDKRTEEPK